MEIEQIRMPAEWEPQDAIHITWPHHLTDWNEAMTAVITCYRAVLRAIIAQENVIIATMDLNQSLLDLEGIDLSSVHLYEMPINDTWTRDHGGISVMDANGRVSICDFKFNGWGEKYPFVHDNLILKNLLRQGCFKKGIEMIDYQDFVLEGGAIESDGKGTILTTSSCLLNANRNHGLSKERVELALKERLGGHRVLWLDYGCLTGDDTDGHVDTLVRFCDHNTLAYVNCEDENDEHHAELQKMKMQLEEMKTSDGLPYNLVPLPMVKPIFDKGGDRLPATYANFLIINGAVLVPTYGVDTDVQALQVLSELFPERSVIGIDCKVLVQQHGSLHCATMQYPKGVLR